MNLLNVTNYSISNTNINKCIFAATEIAFISLNDAKIEKQAKEGNKKAKQIKKMLREPSKFLATIQIGITLAGFLSSAFAADAFADDLAPMLQNLIPLGLTAWRNISIILITIILSYFSLIFGELVPKRLAMRNSEKNSFWNNRNNKNNIYNNSTVCKITYSINKWSIKIVWNIWNR